MGGFDSEYPGAIDQQPPALKDGWDYFPASALKLLVSQIAAMQGEVGNDPVDFTGLGGKAIEFGTVGTFMRQLFRVEGGTKTVAWTGTESEFPVNFTAGRFTAPPMVFCTEETTSPELGEHWFASKITTSGFLMQRMFFQTGLSGTHTVQWLAIQGLFGVDELAEDD